MAMLGEIISEARRPGARFESWIAAREPSLAGTLADEARDDRNTPAGFARAAVAHFARFAPEEDWTHLTSRLRDGDDPGMTCLSTMVAWRLARAAAHRSHATQGDAP